MKIINYKLLSLIGFWFVLYSGFSNNTKAISNYSFIDDDGSVNFKESNVEILTNSYSNFQNQRCYEQFLVKHGDWYFSLNKFQQLPVKAFGKPIKVSNFNNVNDSNVELISRTFIDKYLSEFNISSKELKLIRKSYYDNKWYVTFRQYFNDIEILNSEIELRITKDVKVISFGINYFKNPENNLIINKSNISTTFDPNEKALIGIKNFEILNNQIKILSNYQIKILPIITKNGYILKKVYEVDFSSRDNLFEYISYIDFDNGELIFRQNIHNDINSSVTNKGTIKLKNPSEPDTLVYFNDMKNYFDSDSALTNANGKIIKDINKQVTLFSKFTGPWVYVSKYIKSGTFDTTTAKYSTKLNPGDNLIIDWNDQNSMKGERTLFWHANYIHNYYKKLDSNFVGMDSVLFLTLSFSGSANALSNGKYITFTGCQDPNYKFYESSGVLYHEWGHSVNYYHYRANGAPNGMRNTSCNEATADVTSCMMLDDNLIGRGTKPNYPNFHIRNVKNKIIYPDSLTNESHHDGQILAGAFWDLREMTSAEYVMKLSHKAKYGIPDDINIGIAFSEWFVETLLADDDDDDLTNGTPYFDKISAAFNNHRIGTNLFTKFNFKHIPFQDTKDTLNNYKIEFELSYLPLPNGKPSPIKLYYQINNSEKIIEINAIETAKGKYYAEIPPQKSGTIVRYYFTAFDKLSNSEITLSLSDIQLKPYLFTIGYQEIFSDDFDTKDNWTIGDLTDNASYGKWEIGKPNEIILSNYGKIQPGSGTSGNNCMVTGALGNASNYYNFYPNGKTSITSKSFDLSNNKNPILKFNKWFYNYYFYTTEPTFEVYLSSDNGATWVPAYKTKVKSNEWESEVIVLSDFINELEQVKIKFVVNIQKSQFISWTTEALVDEVKIFSPINSITSVEELNENEWLNITPNPSNGQIQLQYVKRYLGNGEENDITLYSYSANNEIIDLKAYDLLGNLIIKLDKIDEMGLINILQKGVIIFDIQTINGKTFRKSIINN